MCELRREALLHHLTSERRPIDRGVICRELELFGAYSDKIPCAPQWEWDEELDRMIDEGLVILVAGRDVIVDRERLTAAVLKTETDAERQRTLF